MERKQASLFSFLTCGSVYDQSGLPCTPRGRISEARHRVEDESPQGQGVKLQSAGAPTGLGTCF